MKIDYLHCHSFVASLARDAKVAIACGANSGDFAKWLSESTRAEIYSFEPDPRLFRALPKLERVEWIEMAVDGSSGELELGLGNQHCSSAVYREATDQETVIVKKTSLDDFCKARNISSVDFIKIDIEGAELAVLENCSEELLWSIKQITVEFHDFLEPADIPRIKNVVERLQKLGFYFIRFSHHNWGDCLFINNTLAPVSAMDKFGFLFSKYASGVSRITKRLFK